MPSFRTLAILVLAAIVPLTSAVAIPKLPNPTDLAPGVKLELRSNPTTVGVKRAEATHGPRNVLDEIQAITQRDIDPTIIGVRRAETTHGPRDNLDNIQVVAVTRRDINPTTVGAKRAGHDPMAHADMLERELPTTIPVNEKRGVLPPSPEILGRTPGTKTNEKRGTTPLPFGTPTHGPGPRGIGVENGPPPTMAKREAPTHTPVCGQARVGRQLLPERVLGKVQQRCDVACDGGVLVVIGDVQEKISPMLERIYAMKECKAEDIEPIVGDIISIIDGTTAHAKAYVNAEVDLNVDLAVSIDDLVHLLVSLVTSIVACIKLALSITAQVDLDATIKILASLCVSLSAFIQVCCQLGGGLTVALAVKLAPFVGLCARLGVDVSVTAFLKIVS
ncbi:hypothetical protein PQX77_018075 [Marasmius sp. AFHP31]|nr:hypothetical protein PQX77_018075 [Marasmius sp. AFHP31]